MSSSAERRGSLWRKWDLQVHTPHSALNNGFGSDFTVYAKAFFLEALSRRIAVVGVTDYFSIEGYSALKTLQSDRTELAHLVGEANVDAAQGILLLPNVEFRTSVVVRKRNGTDSRVNFHVIFSDEVPAATIEEYFLRELRFTAESAPGVADNRHTLTRANLEELGRALKRQQPEFANRSDLYIGMMNAVIAHEDITAVLTSNRNRFADRYLMIVPADEDLSQFSWEGQAHQTRKLFIQKSHMLFASNPKTRAWGLGQKHLSVDEFVAEFGSLKPCVHGSDAHSPDQLFRPAENRQLWIKADCTFQGLRQLLFEPDSRVYIGEEPPELNALREERATRTLSALELSRLKATKNAEIWFQDSLPLNSGLVAVIGNKGSGKSALADIIAHVGDSKAHLHFSFLTDARFLEARAKRGSLFQATIEWASGVSRTKLLGDPPDSKSGERVKYIPQSYLEEICSDLQETTDSAFYRELMDVIFSHVPIEEQVGQRSLPQLLAHLTEVQRQSIELLVRELDAITQTILELRQRVSVEFKQQLEFQLTQRNEELEAHERAKPAERRPPDADAATLAAREDAAGKIAQIQERIQLLEGEVTQLRERRAIALKQVAAADRLQSRIQNLERQFSTFLKDSSEDAGLLKVEIAAIAKLSIDRAPLARVKSEAEQADVAILNDLSDEVSSSIASRAAAAQRELEEAREALDADARSYDEYLQQLASWQSRRDELVGTSEDTESLNGIRAAIEDLASLPQKIAEATSRRDGIVSEIFAAKERLLGDYRRLYRAVQRFIDEHPVSQHSGQLQFSAHIAIEGFSDRLLEMLHLGKKGSFQGDQGRDRLNKLIRGADLTTIAGVRAFLALVQDHLDRDHRDGKPKPTGLASQLTSAATEADVLGFIYGLEYLTPRFELRWMGKPLDQLSPGERGTLLLVFYLLIDQRRTPLIIDQPEENLDNHTVALTLVPAIRYAKSQRQIIMVTHNPNLAVVCDADQIIHASIDKANGNKVTYTAGAIENPQITRLVVDVLEGTKRLFDKRDARYEVLERLSLARPP
jgi:energy-coupling factor transporter ATP-binding protein EcfA2